MTGGRKGGLTAKGGDVIGCWRSGVLRTRFRRLPNCRMQPRHYVYASSRAAISVRSETHTVLRARAGLGLAQELTVGGPCVCRANFQVEKAACWAGCEVGSERCKRKGPCWGFNQLCREFMRAGLLQTGHRLPFPSLPAARRPFPPLTLSSRPPCPSEATRQCRPLSTGPRASKTSSWAPLQSRPSPRRPPDLYRVSLTTKNTTTNTKTSRRAI